MAFRNQYCLGVVLLLAICTAAQQTGSAAPPAPSPHNDASNSASLPNAPSASDKQSADSTIAAITPVATAPYVPLTGHQKFERWLHYTHSPYTFTSVLFNATYAQAVGDWPTYGGGMQGFGKRFGATLADTEVRGFFVTYLGPVLLHEDPRYFYSGKKGVVPRGWYAATRVLVTRKDNGENTFNTSEVAGTLFTKAVSNAYYPRHDRGFGATMSGTFGALISDAGSNVVREFWPDIRRAFKKHEPERMKKLEHRIPKQIEKAAGAENQ